MKVKNEKDNSSLEIKESDAHEEHTSLDTSLLLDDRKERIANNTNVKDCSSDHESFTDNPNIKMILWYVRQRNVIHII